MDDFKDGFLEGWNAALEAAELKCRPMWNPTGIQGRGVSDVELVWLRRSMPQRVEEQG